MRRIMIVSGAVLGLAAAGCGAETTQEAQRPAAGTASAPAAKTTPATHRPNGRSARTLIVFRRVRYEGATLRTLYVHADGSLNIDVPNGGAGGAKFTGRLTPRALRAIRRDLAATPWRHLSRRRVRYDRSGAYFMLHRAGRDYVAMADGMSPDLVAIVDRLNGVLSGEGQSRHEVAHRFGSV